MPNLLLITGAAGFVGRYAVEFALKESQYDFILATDLRAPDYQIRIVGQKKFAFIKADLTKPEDVAKIRDWLRAFPDCKITVWHIGGCFNYSASRELLYRVNVLGTKALLEMLLSLGIEFFKSSDETLTSRIQRFVFWSGGVVYGDFNHPDGVLPANENYPVNPQNDYGWSKKEAEDWVLHFHKTFGLSVTIMRLAAIYGPNSRYGMGSALVLNARGHLAPIIAGNRHNKTALVHVEDVIRVASFLSRVPEADGEVYNVVDYTAYSLKTISGFIGEKLNNKPFSGFSLPAWVFKFLIKLIILRAKQLGGKPIIDPELGNMVLLNSHMSNQKLRKLARNYYLDDSLFQFPDSLIGLAKTIEWYGKEGWL